MAFVLFVTKGFYGVFVDISVFYYRQKISVSIIILLVINDFLNEKKPKVSMTDNTKSCFSHIRASREAATVAEKHFIEMQFQQVVIS